MLPLEPIIERLKRASPGPWEWWTSNSFRRLSGPDGHDGGIACAVIAHDGVPDISIREGDMDLIAHARMDLLNLVREVKDLRAELRKRRAKRTIDCYTPCRTCGGNPDYCDH